LFGTRLSTVTVPPSLTAPPPPLALDRHMGCSWKASSRPSTRVVIEPLISTCPVSFGDPHLAVPEPASRWRSTSLPAIDEALARSRCRFPSSAITWESASCIVSRCRRTGLPRRSEHWPLFEQSLRTRRVAGVVDDIVLAWAACCQPRSHDGDQWGGECFLDRLKSIPHLKLRFR